MGYGVPLFEGLYRVSSLGIGSLVKFNAKSKNVYRLVEYNRSLGMYVLEDISNFGSVRYVKPTKTMYSGFYL